MKKFSIFLAILLFISISGDTITTSYCMTKYANYLGEYNPISQWMMNNGVYYLFKGIVLLISTMGVLVISKTNKVLQIALIVVSIACIGLMTYTTISNIQNAIKIEQLWKSMIENGLEIYK